MSITTNFSNYLIFADESGDHILKPNYPNHPIFVLAFCVFEKSYYAGQVLPKFAEFKMQYFATNNVIFHEMKIRKQTRPFAFLQSQSKRELFMNDLNDFIESLDFKVIATAINKLELQRIHQNSNHPYYTATNFCLEKLQNFLIDANQNGKTTVTFEARGKKEDKELELCFRKLNQEIFSERFDIEIISKLSNSSGLQISDLIARPIARHIINPHQSNRAFEIIRKKLINCVDDLESGLKIYP